MFKFVGLELSGQHMMHAGVYCGLADRCLWRPDELSPRMYLLEMSELLQENFPDALRKIWLDPAWQLPKCVAEERLQRRLTAQICCAGRQVPRRAANFPIRQLTVCLGQHGLQGNISSIQDAVSQWQVHLQVHFWTSHGSL